VTTDVASYYDCIPLGALRNQLSALSDAPECMLDLLFYILGDYVWRPDYMPNSGVGLPQLSFDAPRLLGFAYLFHADRCLLERARGDFVRWMDDINFGARSKPEARAILHNLETVVNSTGLHLNSGKTKILDRPAAREHFALDLNRRLTFLQNRLESAS